MSSHHVESPQVESCALKRKIFRIIFTPYPHPLRGYDYTNYRLLLDMLDINGGPMIFKKKKNTICICSQRLGTKEDPDHFQNELYSRSLAANLTLIPSNCF